MLIKEQKQYHPLARRVKNSISLNLKCIALQAGGVGSVQDCLFYSSEGTILCQDSLDTDFAQPVARTTLSGYASHAVRIPPLMYITLVINVWTTKLPAHGQWSTLAVNVVIATKMLDIRTKKSLRNYGRFAWRA
jgi:hypothetical protein